MKNSRYEEGCFRVRVDPAGKQRLCFPDGTVVPYEIDNICRQSTDQAIKGQCTYIVRLFVMDGEKMADAIDIQFDESCPVIIFKHKRYDVHSIQLCPQHLDDPRTAIIEVTAYPDCSA